MPNKDPVTPSIRNPFEVDFETDTSTPSADSGGPYDQAVREGELLRARPRTAAGPVQIGRQHAKRRMTVWERLDVLRDPGTEPTVLYQNWGPNLDGASIVTAIVQIGGREVAVYGHDFTVRAGSMDATNGTKLANVIRLAGRQGMPLVGMNDSAGAFVPAGIGGLDGYAEAFTALRKISGLVPSIMCMFGYNAGGGSYLPRQGSFMIQPANTFFGLTGPGVVKSVLGEDVTADELGGPGVHGQSGVSDLTVRDEVGALRTARRLLSYLPGNNHELAPYQETSDPVDRPTGEIDTLLRKAFNSPTAFNTPIDVSIILQQICDHGDYFELQPQRARNTLTAFGRLGGHVVGFVCNNSAVASGQIDVDAAYKNSRFIRFCNLYNIPVIFMEDTTGFLPGRDQESRGIVQAGRAMLDSIIDLRTPRLLLIIRNAFGGAYAAFNCYATGADHVMALPTTRVAVMGPAGREFVYKSEMREMRSKAKVRLQEALGAGASKEDAEAEVAEWVKAQDAAFSARYERELMNPKEALSLGSISEIVPPTDVRAALAKNLDFYLSHYTPEPLQAVQREFH
ncbi:MAG: acetyl-CoA carboxylase carboxyltransferase subunit [Deltaproteobacteria bacterium]|nr:acetyl-CoA carboxylase carboxyltransferase subunit [Deltaproteobacteria bacterium]NND28326.1 acetyl-CoA carboxylase carboxyltransferase subunit [Myxococcales bacterium]MBT8465995.1 acetyl-CoA carboxylase carboxyltransferase subunit [Deltaproteobacteria bacterium]MBT8480242.1 acetyl-CoA carboxylase carboxyltransferase subunit [Deltaproteobacteria bacterium]NNK07929.1 acetyl-CoA carboxylase carboxyltransferase subunit [Myxococcales bacterium]